jgi:hypothetical protein
VTDEELQQLAAALRAHCRGYTTGTDARTPDWVAVAVRMDVVATAADAIAGLLADKQHLQDERADHLWLLKGSRMTLDAIAVGREGAAHAEAQAQRIVDHIGHAVTDEPPHTLVENERLRAEVVSLRERLAAVNAGTCRYVSVSDEGTAYCTLAETSSERVWLSWLVGVCVDEDWPTVRTAIETRLAAPTEPCATCDGRELVPNGLPSNGPDPCPDCVAQPTEETEA